MKIENIASFLMQFILCYSCDMEKLNGMKAVTKIKFIEGPIKSSLIAHLKT